MRALMLVTILCGWLLTVSGQSYPPAPSGQLFPDEPCHSHTCLTEADAIRTALSAMEASCGLRVNVALLVRDLAVDACLRYFSYRYHQKPVSLWM